MSATSRKRLKSMVRQYALAPAMMSFGLRLHRDALQLVVVDISLVVDAVGHDVEIQSGEVHRASVGQMSAVIQVHAHHRVAGL